MPNALWKLWAFAKSYQPSFGVNCFAKIKIEVWVANYQVYLAS